MVTRGPKVKGFTGIRRAFSFSAKKHIHNLFQQLTNILHQIAWCRLQKASSQRLKKVSIGMLCECEKPPLGLRREGIFFVSSIRLFRHESDLIPVFWQPSALVQAPPRRDDESTIGFCFPVGMSTRHGTVQRTQHQRLDALTVWATQVFLFFGHG